MFSTRSKTKSTVRKPVTASAASAPPQKAPDKARPGAAAPAPVGGQEAAEAQDARPVPKCSSSLNPNLSFEGKLEFSGTVLIDCDFRGTVATDDTLVVGVSANLHAEVTAGVVEVSGKVHGNIKAASSVKIYSGGEVHGNIETPTISMEEGVIFEGNCTRPGSAQHAAPASTSQPPASSPQTIGPQTISSQTSSPQASSPQTGGHEPSRPAQPRLTSIESSLESARKKMIVSSADLAAR